MKLPIISAGVKLEYFSSLRDTRVYGRGYHACVRARTESIERKM